MLYTKKLMRSMAKSVFQQVNEEIFNNELPPLHFNIIRTMPKGERWYAFYFENVCTLVKAHIDRKHEFFPHQLFAIVAHETIHHAQNYYGLGSYNHNGAFFRHYARKIEKAYGHKIAAVQECYTD